MLKYPKIFCFAGGCCLLLVGVPFFLLNTTPSAAETKLSIPAEYGQVVYQSNPGSPYQLFIIGMSHRDSLTRLNGRNTSRVQAEVYKVGDWLVRNQGLELLLPEGFFKDSPAKIGKKGPKFLPPDKTKCPEPLDIKVLEEQLSNDKVFVNAEILLKEHHQLRIQQIEDKDLYQDVTKGILRLVGAGRNNEICDYSLLKSELDYLQERRTAAMLQRAPEVIDRELREGYIKEKKAIFTIGMSHLCIIINYLNANKIVVQPVPGSSISSIKNDKYVADLNLSKENFGVSVIIPRTLANDQKVLEMNKLDTALAQFKKQSLSPVPPPVQ